MIGRSWLALAAGIAIGVVAGHASTFEPTPVVRGGTLRIDAGTTSARVHPGDGRWPRLPAGRWSIWWDGDTSRSVVAWREGAGADVREVPRDAPLHLVVAAGERWHLVEASARATSSSAAQPRLTVLEAAR